MEQSGTLCPFEGKIGTESNKQWEKYNKLRPDYNIYTKRLKIVEKQYRRREKISKRRRREN